MTDRQAGRQTDSSPLFCIILCRIPFPPELFHIGIVCLLVCLLLWPISSPQRSLGHSLFKQKSSQKFFIFFFIFVVVVFVFYFIKIPKLALPCVMLKFERGQYCRKKERWKSFFLLKKRISLVSTAIAMNRLTLLSHLTWLP